MAHGLKPLVGALPGGMPADRFTHQRFQADCLLKVCDVPPPSETCRWRLLQAYPHYPMTPPDKSPNKSPDKSPNKSRSRCWRFAGCTDVQTHISIRHRPSCGTRAMWRWWRRRRFARRCEGRWSGRWGRIGCGGEREIGWSVWLERRCGRGSTWHARLGGACTNGFTLVVMWKMGG